MLVKQNDSITSQNFGCGDFWRIVNSFLDKGKLAIPPFNSFEVLCPASGKAKLFPENFFRSSNLDKSCISLPPVFPSRTNLTMHNISVTPKMVKRVIINLDLLKVAGPYCISVVVLKNCWPEICYVLAELFNKCL